MITTAELVESLRGRLGETLVATDFDGTLAPLVPDPETSRPVDGAIDALAALTKAGAEVAVVTGRAAETALRLGGLDVIPGLVIEGLYGLESWHDGTLTTPDSPPSMTELQQRLPGVLVDNAADPDIWIEDKRLSLVVHARRTADPDAALEPLQAPVQALADELGLEVHAGRDVLELRIPGYDKAGAIERLAEGHRAVLYLGDDLGDLPAFALMPQLRERGVDAWGVAVLQTGAAEVAAAADLTVDTPDDVVALLRRLV